MFNPKLQVLKKKVFLFKVRYETKAIISFILIKIVLHQSIILKLNRQNAPNASANMRLYGTVFFTFFLSFPDTPNFFLTIEISIVVHIAFYFHSIFRVSYVHYQFDHKFHMSYNNTRKRLFISSAAIKINFLSTSKNLIS